MAQDAAGNDYVTDQARNVVNMYSLSGGVLTGNAIITTSSLPYGIAVDAVREKIYVSLPQSYQVAVYSLKPPHRLLTTIN